MSLNLPTLNCRYITTQAPGTTSQEDGKCEQSDRVYDQKHKEEDKLRGGRPEILRRFNKS